MFGFKRRAARRRRLEALTLYTEKRRIYDPSAINPRIVQESGGRYGLTPTDLANLTNGMPADGHKHAGSQTGVVI